MLKILESNLVKNMWVKTSYCGHYFIFSFDWLIETICVLFYSFLVNILVQFQEHLKYIWIYDELLSTKVSGFFDAKKLKLSKKRLSEHPTQS